MRLANQLLAIHGPASRQKLRSLRLANNHAAPNAMLIGIKDSLVSAPSTPIIGRNLNFCRDRLHKSANRKKPSPASTSPASLIFGTQKFRKYSSDATTVV